MSLKKRWKIFYNASLFYNITDDNVPYFIILYIIPFILIVITDRLEFICIIRVISVRKMKGYISIHPLYLMPLAL